MLTRVVSGARIENFFEPSFTIPVRCLNLTRLAVKSVSLPVQSLLPEQFRRIDTTRFLEILIVWPAISTNDEAGLGGVAILTGGGGGALGDGLNSIAKVLVGGVGSALPYWSIARTLNVCEPLPSPV